jgi:DNA-binding IclR family transcriptional regulator
MIWKTIVQSVDRTLDMLEALVRADGDVGLSQLHDELGYRSVDISAAAAAA